MTRNQIKKFANLLRDRRFKIRPGCKVTVSTKTFKTTTLFTIEGQMKNRNWLPLKFPNGRWYFKSQKTRNAVFQSITATIKEAA